MWGSQLPPRSVILHGDVGKVVGKAMRSERMDRHDATRSECLGQPREIGHCGVAGCVLFD